MKDRQCESRRKLRHVMVCIRQQVRKARHLANQNFHYNRIGGLGATYAVHLWLIGKLIGDFLLFIIELFSLDACFRFVTIQSLRANIDWKSPILKGVGHFGPVFQVEVDVPHQPFVHG